MTLTVKKNKDGLWDVDGTKPGGSALLGNRYFNVGTHHIGFDHRFPGTPVMRAFHDPEADEEMKKRRAANSFDYLGYVQFAQLQVLGHPVAPQTFGGQLADRQPFTTPAPAHVFVDFMGTRLDTQRTRPGDVAAPWFAFNGVLTRPSLISLANFCDPDLPNGSVHDLTSTASPAAARCASVVAQASTGMLTTTTLRPFLTSDNLLTTLPGDQIPAVGAYRIVLNELSRTTLPGRSGPLLVGLRDTDVEISLVGDIVLLGLPGDEDFAVTLAVRTVPSSTSGPVIEVYTLSPHDVASLQTYLAPQSLLRVKDAFDSAGIRIDAAGPRGRGNEGLYPNPFKFSSWLDVVKIRYTTVLVPGRQGALGELLSGFRWAVRLGLHPGSQTFVVTAIEQPQEFHDRAEYDLALRQWSKAKIGVPVDPAAFTAAAIPRTVMATTVPPRYITPEGADIPEN